MRPTLIKLSTLQKEILVAALRGRTRSRPDCLDPDPARPDVEHAALLTESWGDGADGNRDAARAALARAITRLVARGLVTRVARGGGRGAGVSLTPEGLAAARSLAARDRRRGPRARPPGGRGSGVPSGDAAEVVDELREALREAESDAAQSRASFLRAQAEASTLREQQRLLREELRRTQQELGRLRAAEEERHRAEEEAFRRAWETFDQAFGRGRRGNTGSQSGRARAGTQGVPPGVADALAVLGLAHPCTKDEIKAAYRRMMKEVHPDWGGSDEQAVKVNAAYEVLKNNYSII